MVITTTFTHTSAVLIPILCWKRQSRAGPRKKGKARLQGVPGAQMAVSGFKPPHIPTSAASVAPYSLRPALMAVGALDCPISYERFDSTSHRPLVLILCGHTVCSACVVRMRPQQVCYCRQRVLLPAAYLPANLALLELAVEAPGPPAVMAPQATVSVCQYVLHCLARRCTWPANKGCASPQPCPLSAPLPGLPAALCIPPHGSHR